MFPSSVLITGNVPAFIAGSNFANSTALSVKFDETVVRGTFVSPTLITCIVPSRVASHTNVSGAVPVDVSNNGFDYTGMPLTIAYIHKCPPGSYVDGRGPAAAAAAAAATPTDRSANVCV